VRQCLGSANYRSASTSGSAESRIAPSSPPCSPPSRPSKAASRRCQAMGWHWTLSPLQIRATTSRPAIILARIPPAATTDLALPSWTPTHAPAPKDGPDLTARRGCPLLTRPPPPRPSRPPATSSSASPRSSRTWWAAPTRLT